MVDEALIRWLFEEHGRAALAYATRLCGSRTVAEEIVQEVFIRAWRRPEVLNDSKSSVRGWLLTAVYGVVIDRRCADEPRSSALRHPVAVT
ncbi:RNA polymerase sigma-70 factor, ECF subfamily [Lentzea jiangxiensis]|uniref:RNA polymerase sigma-70 factor, ECF subfamily n=1 Tax=Lentzea jiangxiensis TaxID=641025 RepID=A0A1H0SLW1_9PSEU|nr:RNA polymerase sigma-70 factor, ECF subfamily [Lentzea jiangxiensis]